MVYLEANAIGVSYRDIRIAVYKLSRSVQVVYGRYLFQAVAIYDSADCKKEITNAINEKSEVPNCHLFFSWAESSE